MIDLRSYFIGRASVKNIEPSGTKEITNTDISDVKEYAFAKVTDSNLVSENIKKDVSVLGIIGSFEGTQPAPVFETQRGVNFIDYDGTIVAVWQYEELAGKTALPPSPSHEGLISDGWNWSLADIKEFYATGYPSPIDVGQLYKTVSGLTEIDVEFTKKTGLSIDLKMTGEKDWGDGTKDEETSHTYTEYGKYTIKCGGTVTGTDGMFNSYYSDRANSSVTDVRLGDAITTMSYAMFTNCLSLSTVTLHNDIISINKNGYIFNKCGRLKCAVMPTIPTYGNNTTYMFYNCAALRYVSIPYNKMTSIGSLFAYSCTAITHFLASSELTSMGNYAFEHTSGIRIYDFSRCKQVPSGGLGVFGSISNLAKIVVPDALYDSWLSSWSNYADYIYKASEILTSND